MAQLNSGPGVFAGGLPAVLTFAAAPLDATTVVELCPDAASAQANVRAYQLGVVVGGTAQGAVVPSNDGTPPVALDMIGDLNLKTGIYALERVDLFNILCLPHSHQERRGRNERCRSIRGHLGGARLLPAERCRDLSFSGIHACDACRHDQTSCGAGE